jgi:hypothetical protein
LRRQRFIEPSERGRDPRVLFPQATDELHGEGRLQRDGHTAQNVIGPIGFRPQQLIGKAVGGFPGRLVPHHALRKTPQVLNEHDAECDGDRPKLADGQRLHSLIGAQKATQTLRIEAAVGMGHEGPGKAIDARIALERAIDQTGELPLKTRRQVSPDGVYLLLHDVKVVDEPIRCRCDRSRIPRRRDHGNVALAQGAFVVLQPPFEAMIAVEFGRNVLSRRETLGMLLQPFDAEKLGADRLLMAFAGGADALS